MNHIRVALSAKRVFFNFEADLRKANLLGATLPDYIFSENYKKSSLPRPNLDGATMPDGTIYSGDTE